MQALFDGEICICMCVTGTATAYGTAVLDLWQVMHATVTRGYVQLELRLALPLARPRPVWRGNSNHDEYCVVVRCPARRTCLCPRTNGDASMVPSDGTSTPLAQNRRCARALQPHDSVSVIACGFKFLANRVQYRSRVSGTRVHMQP